LMVVKRMLTNGWLVRLSPVESGGSCDELADQRPPP
jgi:hypothetical protein